jgi:hypothetical protein
MRSDNFVILGYKIITSRICKHDMSSGMLIDHKNGMFEIIVFKITIYRGYQPESTKIIMGK